MAGIFFQQEHFCLKEARSMALFNNELMLKLSFFVCFIAFLLVRMHWLNLILGHRGGIFYLDEDPYEGRLLYRLQSTAEYLYYIFICIFALGPDWINALAIPLGWGWRWLGVFLAFNAIFLLEWVHRSLGRHFHVILVIQPDHALITHGPYRWVRHPMYSIAFIMCVAIGLVSANYLFWSILPCAVFLAYLRTHHEEKLLIGTFGDQYRNYMRRTPRFLPFKFSWFFQNSIDKE